MDTNTLVSVKQVTKIYSSEKSSRALDELSLDLPTKAFAALVGPSGSGKTTLLNLIAGLDVPTSGEIWIKGQKISHLSNRERALFRRDHLGFVFQAYNLFTSLSAIENVEYTRLIRGDDRRRSRVRALECLAQVGLEEKANSLPTELSGGQQQRVAVARALCSEPSLILADEPTANLDSSNARSLIELFRTLNREFNVSFLFSTHDSRLYEYVDHQIRLEDGHLKSAAL